jgi:hypothetical protein
VCTKYIAKLHDYISMSLGINPRYAKGHIIAVSCRIRKVKPNTTTATMWKVESMSTPGLYYSVIMFKDGKVVCNCEDFKNREETCKHIYGVCLYETQ